MQIATITTLPGPCRNVVLFPDRGFEKQQTITHKEAFYTQMQMFSFFSPQTDENSGTTSQQRVEGHVRDRAGIIVQ